MSDLTNYMLAQSARKLIASIHKFCRARVSAGLCERSECEFCPCNKTKEIAESYTESEENNE